jgi:hypothetical protein
MKAMEDLGFEVVVVAMRVALVCDHPVPIAAQAARLDPRPARGKAAMAAKMDRISMIS